ncbi:sigma-70 family RNA polymerase sigma factor [Microbacterium sp. ASV49]|uniref:Sigma-70 family RNA polymerase sigma factor n=1 Tax=Microbacterium candidum TaxID=3041922 RepID=A0ABT7MWZ2_9MICO|nr:sigma-70 family RNA polymerase sigma factor [Microbacterium sp. ASV49]MDL9978964.1 sigma-70 family RNA polymerase sigma factor [Microbacterium sp. ASV49]
MSPDDTRSAAPDLTEMSDGDLVLRSRSGDTAAFGELWRRHYRSGIVAAQSITSSIDADDLVQEAYARIFQAIKRGGGPTGAFRAYLFTSIRNTAAAWGRARKETAIDELDAVEDPAASAHATDEALDRSLTNQAFRSLPTRWQEVLWYTEIEQLKPAEAAPLLGMSANAVAQLAVRAREGLREAWIQAHLRSVEDGSECQYTIEKLGAHARGNLGLRARKRIDAHIAECPRCAIVASEADEVQRRLALVLLPLFVGAGGAAAYLASLQSGGAALVAVAGMPSSVVAGAVVAGSAGTTGTAGAGGAVATAGSAAAGSGGSGAGSAAAGSAGSASGSAGTSGTVAAVAATAAGVLVAGAVAVAVVLSANSSPAPAGAAAKAPIATHAPATVPAPAPTPAPVPPVAPVAAPVSPVAPAPAAPVARRAAPPAPAPVASAPTAPPAAPPTTPPTPVPPAPVTPGLVSVQVASGGGNAVTITATVRTTPGATVTATARGFVRGSATAGPDGLATVVIVPKVADVVQNTTVSFAVPGAAPFEMAIADLIAAAG